MGREPWALGLTDVVSVPFPRHDWSDRRAGRDESKQVMVSLGPSPHLSRCCPLSPPVSTLEEFRVGTGKKAVCTERGGSQQARGRDYGHFKQSRVAGSAKQGTSAQG